MGAWGYEVWDSDESADWFGTFGKSMNYKMLEETIMNFEVSEEDFDTMRASAYVLEHFGKTYVWGADLELLDKLLDKAISNLTEIYHSDVLLEWNEPEKIKESVKSQIENLKNNK